MLFNIFKNTTAPHANNVGASAHAANIDNYIDNE